jgi:hypothetical protein
MSVSYTLSIATQEALTILTIDVNLKIEILIFSSASRSTATTSRMLLVEYDGKREITYSLRLISISRVSLTARGGDGGAGGGGGVGERALTTPGETVSSERNCTRYAAYHGQYGDGA